MSWRLGAFVVLTAFLGSAAVPALGHAGPAQAREASDWSRVTALKRGTWIEVTMRGGLRVFDGKFVAANEKEVTISMEGRLSGLPRDEIRDVAIIGHGHARTIWAIVGGAAVGTGISVGVARGTHCEEYNGDCVQGRKALLVLIPVVTAAVAGRLVSPHHADEAKVVYVAPASASPTGPKEPVAAAPPSAEPGWESLRRVLPPSLQGRK